VLTKARRGVADVATSGKRVELQISTLEQQAAKLASQRERALAAGDEVLASEARSREGGIQRRLSGLRRQLHTLTGQEERLTLASQRLQAKVEDFRVQKETIKATYTAAEGSQRVREAGTEVETGAGTLVARSRAHTLAEARQRMRLTQAQVAERMHVRQERVSAIERAEPGATEVRTLAAYVRALGGRLEVIADIGGERITLR
jgi:phage shock protein A